MSCAGSATVAAKCRNTASPDFMSEVPQPYSSPPSSRLGTLSAAGTVSMWPASSTRDGAAEVRAGQHGIAVADDLEVCGLRPQRGLDLVGDALFLPRLAGDVHQRRGQRDRVGRVIQAHEGSRLVQ